MPNPKAPLCEPEAEAVARAKPEQRADAESGGVRNNLRRVGALALLASALASMLFALHLYVIVPHPGLDFLGFYAAGKILRQGNVAKLYDPGLNLAIEKQIVANSDPHPFVHPPFEAWLFAKLAYFPFSSAYLVWALFNLGVLSLIFYLLRFTGRNLDDNRRLVWLAVCFPLTMWTLVLGQDSLLVALVVLAAYLAMKRGREFVGGLALGVGLFRPEIVLPFAFIFLLRRRWKVMAGLLSTSILLALTSAAVVGWKGVREYASVLWSFAHNSGRAQGLPNMAGVYRQMPTLNGFLTTVLGGVISQHVLLALVLSCTVFLLGWAAWKFKSVATPSAPSFDLEFSLSVMAGLAGAYYLFAHELTPLIVAAFLMLGYESEIKRTGNLKDRLGTALLLLTVPLPIVGPVLGITNFSAMFLVLLGLILWLSREISRVGRTQLAR